MPIRKNRDYRDIIEICVYMRKQKANKKQSLLC